MNSLTETTRRPTDWQGKDMQKRIAGRYAAERRFKAMGMAAIALSAGIAENGVEVIQLPDDVLAILAEASSKILEAESQKGERAAKAADIYRTLMTDLGYL